MGYCGPRGIPHSTFLEWSDLDREKALVWMVDDMSRCRGCGISSADPDPYHVDLYRCPHCEELQGEKIDVKTDGLGMYKRMVPGPGEVSFRRR